SGLRRDAGALGAFVPAADAAAVPEGEPESQSEAESEAEVSISDAVAAAAGSTLRPSAVSVGKLDVATVDPAASAAVVLVLGEMIDAAIASGTDVVVSGSVQPEGYHFVVEGAAGERGAELASIAEALRE